MDWIKNALVAIRDPLIAALRTGTAAAVTFAITWLVGIGVAVPEGFEVAVNTVVFGLTAAGYNLFVSFLERKVHPIFGVLVLIPRAPAYAPITPGDAIVLNDDAMRMSGSSPPDHYGQQRLDL